MQNFQRMYEVYWTDAATEIVTMTPGTMPRTENDLGQMSYEANFTIRGLTKGTTKLPSKCTRT
jgi:hypothetical protein